MKRHSLWSVLMLTWLSAANTPMPAEARNASDISLSERERDGETMAGSDMGGWEENAARLDDGVSPSLSRKAPR